MNKQTVQQYLPLIKALAEGKTIRYKSSFDNKWRDATDLSFGLPPDHYRIKPEPIKQEFYYIIHKEGANNPRGYCFYTYNNLPEAERFLKEIDPKGAKYVIMHANAESIEGM